MFKVPTPHLKSLNTKKTKMYFGIGNPCPGQGQALKCGRVKPVNLYLQVQRTGHTGILTVQGNGEFIVRNLNLQTDIVNIHDAGTIKASGKGYTGGDGAGASSGGGGYGGRGGVSTATGKIKCHHFFTYSLYKV